MLSLSIVDLGRCECSKKLKFEFGSPARGSPNYLKDTVYASEIHSVHSKIHTAVGRIRKRNLYCILVYEEINTQRARRSRAGFRKFP